MSGCSILCSVSGSTFVYEKTAIIITLRMRAVDILHKKRNRLALSPDEIAYLVCGFTAGDVPSYQISAFLMAVSLNGMSADETRALTESMLSTGAVIDLSDIPGTKIDKHSTGGVGDKTSLVVAPLAAAAGLVVPMISGRALGHSGGTLDKLEAIPGFDVHLDEAGFRDVVAEVGCSIIGQTDDIAPADRKLYALRDVTSTIDSLPLITASILSKKLSEGISGLVLDVKFGSGAFMKTVDEAETLSRLLLSTAKHMGTEGVALLTNMNQPLGTHVGNSLEVEEALAVLEGRGTDDLTELCLHLTAHMLLLGGVVDSVTTGEARAREELTSGRGRERFDKLVLAQKGNLEALPVAPQQQLVRAGKKGFVSAIETESVGRAAMILGAGRRTVDDTIDPSAGLIVHEKLGSEVEAGSPLVTLRFSDPTYVEEATRLIESAFLIDRQRPPPQDLVAAVIKAEETIRSR